MLLVRVDLGGTAQRPAAAQIGVAFFVDVAHSQVLEDGDAICDTGCQFLRFTKIRREESERDLGAQGRRKAVPYIGSSLCHWYRKLCRKTVTLGRLL